MTRPDCRGLQELAAYADGSVSSDERRAIEAHLADCDDCRELVAETVRIRDELEVWEEPPVESIAELREKKAAQVEESSARRRWIPALPAAAAAVLVVVLWGPVADFLAGRSSQPTDLPVAVVAERLADSGARHERFVREGWDFVRSDREYAEGRSISERSFRLGVRLVDLEVALRAGDSDAALESLEEIAQVAGSFDLSEHLEYGYRQVQGALEAGDPTGEQLEASRDLAELVVDVVETAHFNLGKWAEAGRLAAVAGDVEFLSAASFRNYPATLPPLELSTEASAGLDRVRQGLDGPLDAEAIDRLAQSFSDLVLHGGNS